MLARRFIVMDDRAVSDEIVVALVALGGVALGSVASSIGAIVQRVWERKDRREAKRDTHYEATKVLYERTMLVCIEYRAGHGVFEPARFRECRASLHLVADGAVMQAFENFLDMMTLIAKDEMELNETAERDTVLQEFNKLANAMKNHLDSLRAPS